MSKKANTGIEKSDAKKSQKDKENSTQPKPVDWKDPKLIAEMLAAAGIIVVFMAATGGFASMGW